MPNTLSTVELGALAYVAENRLREAQDIRALAADSELSEYAQAYANAVADLFAAIRKREATRAAPVLSCYG